MALKGDLLSADLSNVFQMLALNGKRGLLTVQDRVNPVARRRLFLDGQTVMLADPLDSRPSPALLVEMGRLTYEAYASARRRAERFDSDVWHLLRAQGTLGAQDEDAWRARAEHEAVLEVFLWRNIRFSLDESAMPPPAGATAGLHVDHLIMEAARRQDEWRHVVEAIGSHREVFRRCDIVDEDLDGLDGVARIVLDHVNGTDASADIVLRSALPRYIVELSLASLLERGLVARLTLPELLAGGDQLVGAGRIPEAIRLFHAALRADRRSITIHKRLAAAYLDAGEPSKGCAHYRYCAGALLAAGHRDEALAILQLVWKLLPSHFKTLESIISVLARDDAPLTRDDRACLADARRLLALWQDTGDLERAVSLARGIWQIDASDRSVLATVARLNVRLGRHEEAVGAYLSLAARLREDNDLRQALDVYRTLASIEAGGTKLYEAQILELKRQLEHEHRKRSRFRAGRLAVAGIALVCVLFGVYVWLGERAIGRLEGRAPDDAAAEEALAIEYDSVHAWYALTPAGARAGERARSLFAQARTLRDAEKHRNERLIEDRARRQQAAEEALAEARRLLKVGDLDQAIERFKTAIATSPNKDFGTTSKAIKGLEDSEQYLKAGRKLLAEADALDPTDATGAFEKRLQAIREYELVPEVKNLRLSVRVETIPPGAWLVIDDGATEGLAPLTIDVDGRGTVRIEARAPGCISRVTTMTLPPASGNNVVVLERTPSLTVDLHEPVVAIVPIGPGRALASARNGRIADVDVRLGKVVARFQPDAIESGLRAPVISGTRALAILEDGRARILDLAALAEIATVRLSTTGSVRAWPAPAGWVVADGPSRVVLLDRGGHLVHEVSLEPDETVLDACATSSEIWLSTGARGVASWNPATGTVVRDAAVSATRCLLLRGGAVIAGRDGRGVVSIDPATRREELLLPHAGTVTALQRLDDSRMVAVLDRHDLVVLDGKTVIARARLSGPSSDTPPVIGSGGNRVAIVLESGWCQVFDTKTGACVAGHTCDRGALPAFVDQVFVNGRDTGQLSFTQDP